MATDRDLVLPNYAISTLQVDARIEFKVVAPQKFLENEFRALSSLGRVKLPII